jgi:DNA-directed RNA polymerase II subunit RPB1
MWEIYSIFGIEAARTFLIKEITRILSFDGIYINPRHVQLLVDSMTRTGNITSVNRDGIDRKEAGPISKGTFEKNIDNFSESSSFVEMDTMKSVSASIMFGTNAYIGTGLVEVKDSDKLPAKRQPIKIPLSKKRF